MKTPQILRRPDDESGSDDGQESTRTRKQVSKRLFLDSAGDMPDGINIDNAAAARYQLLDPNGDHNVDFDPDENPQLTRKFAMFGFHTKIGNVANTVLNDKDDPGTPSDAAAAIREWMAQAAQGTWAERAVGGPGARIDRDALAGAIVEVAQSKGRTMDHAAVLAKLESDAAYLRAARQVPEVATAYATRVGKQQKSIDDLMI